MFVKLVILIFVIGSSGVGVLSVRQSRLQAAHETAEARLRILKLENRTTELKASIAELATPSRLAQALSSEKIYAPAMHHPAKLDELFTTNEEHILDEALGITELSEPNPEIWILDDGTRVLPVDHMDIHP